MIKFDDIKSKLDNFVAIDSVFTQYVHDKFNVYLCLIELYFDRTMWWQNNWPVTYVHIFRESRMEGKINSIVLFD